MINQGVNGASATNMPNIIYLQHEFQSGVIMLNTVEGKNPCRGSNR